MTSKKLNPEQATDKLTAAGAVELEESELEQASGGYSRLDPVTPTDQKTPTTTTTTDPKFSYNLGGAKMA